MKTVFKDFLRISMIVALGLMVSCSNDDGVSFGSGRGGKLPGTIYWSFAGDAGYYDFSKNKFNGTMMKMGRSSSFFDGFDISWDNKKILLFADKREPYNKKRVILRDLRDGLVYDDVEDGNNIFDFRVEWSEMKTTFGSISPDEKYLMIDAQHFADLPTALAGVDEQRILMAYNVGNTSLLSHGRPIWTQNNEAYFKIGNGLFKVNPYGDYSSAPLVAQLPDGATAVTVNKQATKIAYRYKKHIWMSDIDGSNAVQVTNSRTVDGVDRDGENSPVFSPDGKYLAFTGDVRGGWLHIEKFPDESEVIVVGGKFGYLMIIPADGKLYGPDDNHNIMAPTEPGKPNKLIAVESYLIWR